MKLNNFTGRLEHVWKYLEDVKPDHQPANPDEYISLPDTGYTQDFLKYMAKITSEEYAHTEAGDKLEREWIEEMKVKYPWIKIDYQRKANLGLNS